MPEVPFVPGCYYAEHGTDEHATLTDRARDKGEFAILGTDQKTDIFVPRTANPDAARSSYGAFVLEGEVFRSSIEFIPDSFLEERKSIIGKILAKIGLKGN